jgi:sulfoxide reductase heme-binding subunit YedZ
VSARRDGFGGWPLVGAAALFVVALCAAVLLSLGAGEEGTRAAVRATGRTSLLFFCAAYVAGALRRLWRSPASAWLVRNQRTLLFSLGVSHAAHAVFLVRLFSRYRHFELVGAAGGLMGYAVLVALLATSNRAGREWLGERRWGRLHTVGMHYLWFAFTYTVAMSALKAPGFLKLAFVLAGVAALAIRVAGALEDRRSGASAAAAGS